MKFFLLIYSLVFAFCLSIGEAAVFFSTEKYWPLSLDDGAAVAALALSAYIYRKYSESGFLLGSWAYVTGNIYAVLFMRLDPVHGSGERIVLVAVVLAVAVMGLVLSAWNYKNEIKERVLKGKA